MKKNKMMRTASVLLVLTLLTVCVISGTFAKYTTTASGEDTARVAKFGVNITANGETFAKKYDADDNTATVVSGTTDKVVAPGTEGTMAKMTLTGKPEVDVNVSYTGAFSLNGKWTAGGAYYCPLEVTVGTTVIKGLDYTSEQDFVDAVNAAINGTTATYKAGTDLSGKNADSLAISWKWAFEKDAQSTKNDDAKDTALGNAAEPGSVTLKVTTTVTQID